MNQNDIQNQALKIGSAWALIGITSWAELASFLAAIYSALLICEWLWKKIIRPVLEDHGFVKPHVHAHVVDGEGDGE